MDEGIIPGKVIREIAMEYGISVKGYDTARIASPGSSLWMYETGAHGIFIHRVAGGGKDVEEVDLSEFDLYQATNIDRVRAKVGAAFREIIARQPQK